METRFGHDFGGVRVHTDPDAARSAESVGASAYTVGRHMVFAPGQYNPGGVGGRRLLAHELAHVVQQSRGGRPAPGFDTDSPLERGADRAAAAATSAAGAVTVAGSSAPGLARQAAQNPPPPAGGVHVTGRFTASAQLLRLAKVKAEANDIQGALKLVDGVLSFLTNIKSNSWQVLRSLNGLAQTDLEMIANMGISAIQQLAWRLRGGPPPDADFWARSFREYLYARPVLEVLAGDVPVNQSKFAKDVNTAANRAVVGAAVVMAAVVAVPLVIEGLPILAEVAMEASPRLTILAAENPALMQIVSEFVVGKIIQVAETHALTFTVGEVILLLVQVGGTMNTGSGTVKRVNPDGSAEIEITATPQPKGGTATTAGGGGNEPEPTGGLPTNAGTAAKTPGAGGGTPVAPTATTGGTTTPPPVDATPVVTPPPTKVTTTGATRVAPTDDAPAATTDVSQSAAKTPTQPMRRTTPNSVYSATSKTVTRSPIPNPPVTYRRPPTTPTGDATDAEAEAEATAARPNTAGQGAQTATPLTKTQQLEQQVEEVHERRVQIQREIDDATARGRQRLSDKDRADLQAEKASLKNEFDKTAGQENDLQAQIDRGADGFRMSPAARAEVLQRSGGLDEFSGKKPEIWTADHTVPVDEIKQMEGFKQLSEEDQHAVLSNTRNLRGMDRNINSSKGNRSWANWPAGRRAYGDQVVERMIGEEREMRRALQEQIQTLLRQRTR